MTHDEHADLSHEVEKTRLESEKIQEELKALSRPWWQKPAYVGATIPALIGIFSLLSIWFTGALDQQFMALKIQKSLLQMEEIELNSRVEKLEEKENNLETHLATIQQEISDLEHQLETSIVNFHLDAIASISGKYPLYTWSDFKPLYLALSRNNNDASLKIIHEAIALKAPWNKKINHLVDRFTGFDGVRFF